MAITIAILVILFWIACGWYNRRTFSRLHGPRMQALYKSKYGSDADKQWASERFWFAISGPLSSFALILHALGADVDFMLPLGFKRRPQDFFPVGYFYS